MPVQRRRNAGMRNVRCHPRSMASTMVLVYLKTSECIEVEDAFSAVRRDGLLACLDRHGSVTASFPLGDVESFTANPEMAEAIKEEVCEDLTVVANGKVVEEAT